MPQGLRVWNASGVLTLDTSTKVARVVSKINIAPGGSGHFAVSKNGGERLFVILTLANGANQIGEAYIGNSDGSGNVDGDWIWYSISSGTGGYLIWGVY